MNFSQGYSEVPGALGLQDIRPIRGDNYCAIRAAVFQTLLMRLPVPNGDATYATLSHAICNGSLWIQEWQFAGRLPYKGSNVLHGIRQCLNSLDNLVKIV
jgi:Peptidase family C101